jgi:hypothetical protein
MISSAVLKKKLNLNLSGVNVNIMQGKFNVNISRTLSKTYQLVQFRNCLLFYKRLCSENVFLVVQVQWVIPLEQRMIQPKLEVCLCSNGVCKFSCNI